MKTFGDVLSVLDELASRASTNDKKRLIAAYANDPAFLRVIYYALDPYKMFKMGGTIEYVALRGILQDKNPDRVFEQLDIMAASRGVSKEDKQKFVSLLRLHGPEAVEVVNRILNKDLRCGAGYKLFHDAHEAFADLPYHHPMKGGDDFDKFYKYAKDRKNICWSYKLDGTRTWAIADLRAMTVTYLSFNGHELPNFGVLDDEILRAAEEARHAHPDLEHKVIFDGECTYYGGDFSKHMSNFRRLKDVDPSGFRFRIFDIANLPLIFSDRYTVMQDMGIEPWQPYDPEAAPFDQDVDLDAQGVLVTYLPHYTLTSHPKRLTKEAVALGLEGVMLKTWDHLYENKRSLLWCKYKLFETEDLPVVGKFEGKGKHKGKLGGLIVLRNNVRTEVGSGYTDAERKEFWKNPPKMIEVKYQEALESGKLRFPVFVRVRDDKA